jgi:hypothetical protein
MPGFLSTFFLKKRGSRIIIACHHLELVENSLSFNIECGYDRPIFPKYPGQAVIYEPEDLLKSAGHILTLFYNFSGETRQAVGLTVELDPIVSYFF